MYFTTRGSASTQNSCPVPVDLVAAAWVSVVDQVEAEVLGDLRGKRVRRDLGEIRGTKEIEDFPGQKEPKAKGYVPTYVKNKMEDDLLNSEI